MIWRFWGSFVLLWCCLQVTVASAQVERVLPRKNAGTLEGTSFVVGFLQNEVLLNTTAPLLKIFVSSQYDAKVTITYPTGFVETLFVKAFGVGSVTLPFMYENVASESPQRLGIFISSDVPIVVYALNTRAASTDTYTAIPIKSLGKNYYSVCQPNDRYSNAYIDPSLAAIRTGEFMVIATEDNTTVEITPAQMTELGRQARKPFTVTLNKSECYLVKGKPTPLGTGDLSGSRVKADKPVAMLSGHVRASIPTVETNSKDHLVEMLPPVEVWNSEYVAQPFSVVRDTNLVRLIAGTDDVDVTITTSKRTYSQKLAQAGDWVDITLDEPTYYASSKPFLAVQFMPSKQELLTQPETANGDPAMVVLPAVGQYLSRATFRFPELITQTGIENQQFHYYVNIVAEPEALATLRIDTRLVTEVEPMIQWQTVPGTSFHWANIRLPMGTYTMSSDEGRFGAIMYGMSYADSYANILGALYDKEPQDELTPPKYALQVECGTVRGTVTDVGKKFGAKLTEVKVQTDRCVNYSWALSPPTDDTGTTPIDAWVQDPWKDGRFVVHAYDSLGNGKEWLFDYEAPSIILPDSILVEARQKPIDCVRVPIINPDSTKQVIKNIAIAGDPALAVRTNYVWPDTIHGPDTLWVEVCYQGSVAGHSAAARLIVEFDCSLKKEIPVTGYPLADVQASGHNFGSVRIGDTSCARVAIVNPGAIEIVVTGYLPGQPAGDFTIDTAGVFPATIAPGDTLWLRACFTPLRGGMAQRTDTALVQDLPKQTITVIGKGIRPRVPPIIVDFGKVGIGTQADTTVMLMNTGDATCQVHAVLDSAATGFSFPGLQLPASLNPSAAQPLLIRFQPLRGGLYRDSIPLQVDWNGHEATYILVMGEGVGPEITTYNVDLGTITVNTVKDTTVTVLLAAGTAPLIVTSVNIVNSGTSDIYPNFPPYPGTYQPGERQAIYVEFRPTRTGYHEQIFEVRSNGFATPGTPSPNIKIYGMAVEPQVVELQGQLDANQSIEACTTDTVAVRVTNTGTQPVQVQSFRVTLDGDVLVDTSYAGYVILPGAEDTIAIPLVVSTDNAGLLAYTLIYDGGRVLADTQLLNIYTVPPTVDLFIPKNVSPGQSTPVTIKIQSSVVRSLAEPLTVTVKYEADKWQTATSTVTADITDVSGIRQVTVPVIDSNSTLRLGVPDSVLSPYTVTIELPGQTLWSNPAPYGFAVSAEANHCADAKQQGIAATINVCAGSLRMVRIGALGQAVIQLDEHPVQNELRLNIDASKTMIIGLDLVDLHGVRTPLVYNLALEKGKHHCIFSVARQTSGLYGLVLKHEVGETMLPILIVK